MNSDNISRLPERVMIREWGVRDSKGGKQSGTSRMAKGEHH